MHHFRVMPGELAVVRLGPHEPLPDWVAGDGPLVSITRTEDELSIVCPEHRVPAGLRSEGGWTALRLAGPFPFDQVGVLASILEPLARAGVSVFALSTFDTDVVLVRTAKLEEALASLEAAGHLRG